MDKWRVSDVVFITRAAEVSVLRASAGRKRQLMKEDPNYSCSEEPGGEISNPISLILPATAGTRPIRKHNLDGSRCLVRSPKEDDELSYTGNCIWHHPSPDADSNGSGGDVATCLHLVMMAWCQTFLICCMDIETHTYSMIQIFLFLKDNSKMFFFFSGYSGITA